VTDGRLRALRHRVRSGELPPDLMEELRGVARDTARRGLLPASLAPYGQWDDEASDELFAAWYADRLLGRGHLQALLDQAQTVAALRRLARRSLRQHLLNARDRSQADNLYRRLVALLEHDDGYRRVRDARRPQDRWYVTAQADGEPAPWTGAERELLAHAGALGDFIVIRYRAAAAKLSPVLDGDELRRFATGLLDRVGAALTPGLIMRVLSARFDLGEVKIAALDESTAVPAERRVPQDDVVLRDTARAVVAELSSRQAQVLQRSGTETVADTAAALACSVGTVVNEQRRIGELVTRLSEDAAERDRVLKIAADLVYLEDDDE
jgi:hypothetical protein